VFGAILLLIAILAFPLVNCFMVADFALVIYAHITLSILAALYIGVEPAMQCDLYPSSVRNTALSFAYNIATTIFGGTTPYIMKILTKHTGSLYFSSIYIICCSFAGLAALFFYSRRIKA
jgi:MHS family proline/betaine transporter-like MFS transporter